jgi:DnaJ like chaperone protein
MNFHQFFVTHTWWGKILGAFFGYLIAGPPGALFGILIGNFFDRGLANYFSHPYWKYHIQSRNEAQKTFLQTTFLIMGYIAKADGRISQEEIQMASLLMDEMRLRKKEKKLAQELFNKGKVPNFDVFPVLATLKKACHHNPDLLKLFMDIQYKAAKAGGLSPRKIEACNLIFNYFGFAPLHEQNRFYEDFRQEQYYSPGTKYKPQQSELTMAYALLEIPHTASKQEVKRAYRRLISRNHPDKLIAQGLPEAMIKLANDKTQKITKAYELICANKEGNGW